MLSVLRNSILKDQKVLATPEISVSTPKPLSSSSSHRVLYASAQETGYRKMANGKREPLHDEIEDVIHPDIEAATTFNSSAYVLADGHGGKNGTFNHFFYVPINSSFSPSLVRSTRPKDIPKDYPLEKVGPQ